MPSPEASQDYPNKKDCKQQAAAIKPTEQRTAGATHDLHGRKLESGSDLDTNANNTSVLGTDSWPDLSLSNAAKTDEDSMGTEVSNNLTDISKYKSSRGGKIVNYSIKCVCMVHVFTYQKKLWMHGCMCVP